MVLTKFFSLQCWFKRVPSQPLVGQGVKISNIIMHRVEIGASYIVCKPESVDTRVYGVQPLDRSPSISITSQPWNVAPFSCPT